jgi:hypothetical protein
LLPIYEFSCPKKIKLLPKKIKPAAQFSCQFTKTAARKNKFSAAQINNLAAQFTNNRFYL